MKLQLPVSRFPRQFDPGLLEMMDRPDVDPSLLEDDLRNIQRINRWCGAYRLIRDELEIFLARWNARAEPRPSTCSILDFCTGSGDIPRVIAAACRAQNFPIRITATDINPRMTDQARRESADYPEIVFERADLLDPHYAPLSHDWVLCNLALHHFSAEQAVAALQNLWRIARVGILVNDLHRGRPLTLIVKHLIPWMSSNPITRFDAHLSTLRAFTADELRRLAFHADIPPPEIRVYPFGRQALAAWR